TRDSFSLRLLKVSVRLDSHAVRPVLLCCRRGLSGFFGLVPDSVWRGLSASLPLGQTARSCDTPPRAANTPRGFADGAVARSLNVRSPLPAVRPKGPHGL